MAKKKPDLVYVEHDDYFPKDLLEKYFPEVFDDYKDSEKEAEPMKPNQNQK